MIRFWLILGFILLCCEIIGLDFLFWSGLSAILTGFVSFVICLDLMQQLFCFIFLNLLLLVFWWKKLQPYIKQTNNDNYVNQKRDQLIGYRVYLTENLVNNTGRVLIGDVSWPVVANLPLVKGTLIEVFDVKGIVLLIKPCGEKEVNLK